MFKTRAAKKEWLDRPGSDRQFVERSHCFMRMVNRRFGGTRIVRTFVQRQVAACRSRETIRILDIGSGTCDIPLALSGWARRQGLDISFTCIEKDSQAFAAGRAAVERYGRPEVRILREDIFRYRPREAFDFAVGSMIFHHLSNREILRLIRQLRAFVRRGVFINDLCRSPMTYAGVVLLTAIADHRVRHDALLSIQKGFVRQELTALLSQIDNVSIRVRTYPLGRITAWIEFL